MAVPARLVLGLHALALLSPRGAGAVKACDPPPADHLGSYGPAFFQSYGAAGQLAYEFDGEQLFSVDLQTRQLAWRLPELGGLAHFDLQNGLLSIAAIQAHLGALVTRSNRSRAVPVPPSAAVFPKAPVALGEPNVLICVVDNIFPPVLSATWLRNGRPVSEGAAQTGFYSRPDHSFRKFLYLTFVPSAAEVYDCRVEHWGLDGPLLAHWEPPPPPAPPLQGTETLVLALGLAVGLLGLVVGSVLVVTGARVAGARRGRSLASAEQARAGEPDSLW